MLRRVLSQHRAAAHAHVEARPPWSFVLPSSQRCQPCSRNSLEGPRDLPRLLHVRLLQSFPGPPLTCHSSSLRPGPGGRVFLQLDISSHPMRAAGTLPTVILNFARGTNPRVTEADLVTGRLSPQTIIPLSRCVPRVSLRSFADVPSRFLKGVQIIGRVPGPDGRPTQHRKISELSRLSAAKSEFLLEGKKTNVAVRPMSSIRRLSTHSPSSGLLQEPPQHHSSSPRLALRQGLESGSLAY